MEDLTGMRFGMLTVVGKDHTCKSNRGARWVCRCDCGREVTIRSSHLKCGRKTCGMHQKRHDKENRLRKVPPEKQCPHNAWVECGQRDCAGCGWNPDVAKERAEKYGKSLQGL